MRQHRLGKGLAEAAQLPCCNLGLGIRLEDSSQFYIRWNLQSVMESWEKSWQKFKMCSRDLPNGPVVKNLPSNAGDSGSIPGQGTKIPHVVGQLSPHTTTRESPHAATKTRHSQINK